MRKFFLGRGHFGTVMILEEFERHRGFNIVMLRLRFF